MFTIKQVAAAVGVEAATLRAWEQRYGVVAPSRSTGGYRLYNDDEVATLTTMANLIRQGWSAAQAAERATQTRSAASSTDVVHAPDVLARCAEEFDAALLNRALDDAFSRTSFERVVSEWLLPGVEALGAGWASGRVTIAGEHLVTAAVQRRLSLAYEAAGNPVSGPVVLIGLPTGSRHELGVLTFATLVRRLGVCTHYLGADLPPDEWAVAAQTIRPAAVVLAAPMDVDVASVTLTLGAIRQRRPQVPVFVGGACQDSVDGVERLGHDVLDAAVHLATRVQRLPQTVA